MKEIIGKISVVAKTGGIKLVEHPNQWFNPGEKAKDYVKPDLLGQTVKMNILEDGKTFVTIFVQGNPKGEMLGDTGNYPQPTTENINDPKKQINQVDVQRLIVRQKSADIAANLVIGYYAGKEKPVTLEGYRTLVTSTADEIEKHIYRD